MSGPVTLSAFARHLGFVLLRAEPGLAVLRCAWRPEFANMAEVAHGGVVASLIDTACGVALTVDAGGRRVGRVVTVSLTLNYLAPFAGGAIVAEARLVGGGRRLQTAEVRVQAEDGGLVATALGVFRHIG